MRGRTISDSEQRSEFELDSSSDDTAEGVERGGLDMAVIGGVALEGIGSEGGLSNKLLKMACLCSVGITSVVLFMILEMIVVGCCCCCC